MKQTFLISSLVLMLAYWGCSPSNRQPNIVLVVVDDLGAHDVGFMGSSFYETPHIDQLAAGGMVFTNAYAAAANCSPTRASIMTGKYPARLGITDWIRPSVWRSGSEDPDSYVYEAGKKLLCPHYPLRLDSTEVTLAEILHQAGYTTMHIGKWHLGGPGYLPQDQGFDYNFAGCDFGQPPSYYSPYTSEWSPAGIPRVMPLSDGEYLTDREATEAIRFIREHKEKPFFLNLWHYAVHTPIEPKPAYADHFAGKQVTGSQKNPRYAAMIKSVDDAMGRLMEVLAEEGLLENTLIVFFSDNGGHTGYTSNAPLRSGKGNPWEGGIREPLVLHWPDKIKPGSQCAEMVSSIDLLPTICSFSGIEPPLGLVIDGADFSAAVLEEGMLNRKDLFWHFPHYRSYEDVRPFSIVRSGDYKLIRFWEGYTELYDLRNDPSEVRNRADDQPEKVKELQAKLDAWLLETNARIPRINPEFIEDRPE